MTTLSIAAPSFAFLSVVQQEDILLSSHNANLELFPFLKLSAKEQLLRGCSYCWDTRGNKREWTYEEEIEQSDFLESIFSLYNKKLSYEEYLYSFLLSDSVNIVSSCRKPTYQKKEEKVSLLNKVVKLLNTRLF